MIWWWTFSWILIFKSIWLFLLFILANAGPFMFWGYLYSWSSFCLLVFYQSVFLVILSCSLLLYQSQYSAENSDKFRHFMGNKLNTRNLFLMKLCQNLVWIFREALLEWLPSSFAWNNGELWGVVYYLLTWVRVQKPQWLQYSTSTCKRQEVSEKWLQCAPCYLNCSIVERIDKEGMIPVSLVFWTEKGYIISRIKCGSRNLSVVSLENVSFSFPSDS